MNRMLHSDWVDKAIVILDHPSFDHLNVTPRVLPKVFSFYSEYAAFAKFGPLVTSGWVSELEAMEAQNNSNIYNDASERVYFLK